METKTRILIADTNEEFRNLLSELIRDEGDMEVVGAVGDGIEALSKASEEKPDVLICDLVLSKLDGLEVLPRLPEASPGPGGPQKPPAGCERMPVCFVYP